MAKKEKQSKQKQDRILVEAVLRLVAKQGWEKLTLDRFEKPTKIPLAQLASRFADTRALLPLIVEYIGQEAFEACGKPDLETSPRDRLFEVLMARFDALQKHRKAILSIAAATRRNPPMALKLLPSQIDAMNKTLAFVEVPTMKTCPSAKPVALWGIFVAAFRTWKTDETIDMSPTMAALDRYLRYAEKTANLLRIDLNHG